MNLELHILQSFAPSNLNRDDTGSPKDCDFGGVRRARVSSQCWKRSIRLAFQRQGLLKEDSLAVRTRKIAATVAKLLAEGGKELQAAKSVADNALAAVDLGAATSGDSEYLLFVPTAALDQFAKICLAHWDFLQPKQKPRDKSKSEAPKDGESKQKPTEKGKSEVPTHVKDALNVLFSCGKAADLALFGRMIADRPKDNVVAATQVAHALSTHRVDLEFDFYTAVDDLQPEGETGAGMMGTVEYNAACLYRYANIDLNQLRKNLDGHSTLACEAVEAFLKASIEAVPTGKQNSMAAQNPPSMVFVVLRDSGFWSLANAFLRPVRTTNDKDLMTSSIAALFDYWNKLTAMYGEPEGKWLGVATVHPDSLGGLIEEGKVSTVPALVKAAVEHCSKAFEV
jgi:CRISPR system Cascade subunit CasC